MLLGLRLVAVSFPGGVMPLTPLVSCGAAGSNADSQLPGTRRSSLVTRCVVTLDKRFLVVFQFAKVVSKTSVGFLEINCIRHSLLSEEKMQGGTCASTEEAHT